MNPEDLAAILGEDDEDEDEDAKYVADHLLSPTKAYVDVSRVQTL
jgi:hypothetical protein